MARLWNVLPGRIRQVRYRAGRATRRRWADRCAGVSLQLNRPERRVGGCHAAINPAYFFSYILFHGAARVVAMDRQRHPYVGHPQTALRFTGRAFVDNIHVMGFISTRLIMKCL